MTAGLSTIPSPPRPRIAIVGAGAAGLGAASGLAGAADAVLFEASARAGGHAMTVDVDYDGTLLPVDVGFIVYNRVNYPRLTRLFEDLGIATRPSSMSFSVHRLEDGFEWAWRGKRYPGSWLRIAANGRRRRLMGEVLRFNGLATRALAAGETAPEETLGTFLETHGFAPEFERCYILPLVSAIWSMPLETARRFPAARLFEFFGSHRLLNIFALPWRTVEGGSRRYVSRLLARARPQLRLNCPVLHVRRLGDGVEITTAAGGTELFDAVIFACHPHRTLAVLADATVRERALLGAFRYEPNSAVLHRDPALMPQRTGHWASWNAICAPPSPGAQDGAVQVSYSMNSLQGIDRRRPLFVTLNPLREPDPRRVFATFEHEHFQYDHEASAAQARLGEIAGAGRAWHCGAWTGFGFHEDALSSGLDAARASLAATTRADAEPASMASDAAA